MDKTFAELSLDYEEATILGFILNTILHARERSLTRATIPLNAKMERYVRQVNEKLKPVEEI